MTNKECDALLGTSEICEYLKCGKKKLYSLVQDGLPVWRRGLKGYQGSKRAIDEFFYQKSHNSDESTQDESNKK